MKLLSDNIQLKKGAWTPEEDQILISFIKTYGITNWTLMPKAAGLARSAKSCRLRWVNYLRPDLKRGRLTMEEIDTVLKLHESLGNKWSEIAARIPGRTDNEIKNFWHMHVRKMSSKTPRTFKTTKHKYNSCTTVAAHNHDQFYISESYIPNKNACTVSEPIKNLQTSPLNSSESLGDFYESEIDPTIFEVPNFAYQTSDFTQAPKENDELKSFWFNILMGAKYV